MLVLVTRVIELSRWYTMNVCGALCCSKFMRVECYNSRYAYDTALPVSRLVSMVGNSIHFPAAPVANVLFSDIMLVHDILHGSVA